MANVHIIYEGAEEPVDEDLALIRAIFPHATEPMPGLFIVEGERAIVEDRLGTVRDWRIAGDGKLFITIRAD